MPPFFLQGAPLHSFRLILRNETIFYTCTSRNRTARDRLGWFGMSLYLWSILLALRLRVLATPVPGFSPTCLPTSQHVCMLPAHRPIWKLHCCPSELDQRQLAFIHAWIHGSSKLRDVYVPERYHRRILSQHDHHRHLRTRERASHRCRRALSGGHPGCCYFCGAAETEVGCEEYWVGHFSI